MISQEIAWLLKEKYHGVETADFFVDAARLEAGEPLAYIIGSIPFLNTTIYLDSKPLIPRPETEYWTEKVIVELKKTQTTSPKILDLCAGSGCIGIALAKALPTLTVDFVELEEVHLKTILKNCQTNSLLPENYHVYCSDLFLALPAQTMYDVIVSNPPYIDKTLGRTELSVTAHEPETALYGGESGLEIIERIITTAPKFLFSKGQLWLEHEPEQSQAIITMAGEKFSVATHKDQYGIERFSQLVLQ